MKYVIGLLQEDLNSSYIMLQIFLNGRDIKNIRIESLRIMNIEKAISILNSYGNKSETQKDTKIKR